MVFLLTFSVISSLNLAERHIYLHSRASHLGTQQNIDRDRTDSPAAHYSRLQSVAAMVPLKGYN